jgi:hypothetical protein
LSYDVSLMIDTGGDEPAEVFYVGNYTSNVFPMWVEALNGKSLREYHGAPCSEAAGPLADGVKRMEVDPDKYREMNPPNGWGDYEGALRYLRKLAEACAEHAKCTIYVSA